MKALSSYRVGDRVQLRGVGPGTVTGASRGVLLVTLDSPARGAYRAGAGRGSTFRVTDANRIRPAANGAER